METDQEESDADETDFYILPPPPKIQSCREAISALKDAQAFLENGSAFELASLSSTLIDKIANSKQTTLDDFFLIKYVRHYNQPLLSLICCFMVSNVTSLY